MKKIIAGNWKMNKTKSEANNLLNSIHEKISVLKLSKSDIIVFPPYLYIETFNSILKNKGSIIKIGAQNCSSYEKGAYTGEVSCEMLRSIDCNYVIVGHSERREIFKETDEILSQKIQRALNNNITPIFCIGENLMQREKNIYLKVLEDQLKNVLSNVNHFSHNLIIAYEPVWAIGTGVVPTNQQIEEAHAWIKKCLQSLQFEKSPVLYGGSCNASNAFEILSIKNVDGALIGGASLDAESFLKIINTAEEA